jgi:outer membrane protein OmpA-like peptidoglycan-associated protein
MEISQARSRLAETMRYKTYIIRLLVAMILLAGVCQLPAYAQEEQEPARFNREDIRAAVMSLSDTWVTGIHEVALELENNVDTPAVRLHMDQFRLYSMMGAYEIASSPYPGVALLDMMVFTSLKALVWEEYWLPEVYGEAARPVLDKLQKLEAEAWGFAATVLTPEQVRAMQELIVEWRGRHPEAINVSFIRFSSFGELGRKPSLEAAREAGGLLGPLKEAAAAADEIRAMGDRMMFMMLRMQEIVGQRVEMSIKEILRTPEVSGFLTNIDSFEQNAGRYAELLDSLPEEIAAQTNTTAINIVDRVSAERQAAINHLVSGVAIERSAAIVQLLDGVKLERQALMQDVNRLVLQSGQRTEAMATHVFLLAAALLLLYFLMRLMLRHLIDHPSRTFFGTLGVALVLGVIALSVTVAVLLYIQQTRPEPIVFPVVAPALITDTRPVTTEPEIVPDRQVLSVQTLFGSRSSIVNPQFHSALDAVAALMVNDDSLQAEVHGYSDSVGDPARNQVLSEQRAFAVARYLESAGIDAERMQVNGRGSSAPVAADDNAGGRARNRRVEVIVIKLGGATP